MMNSRDPIPLSRPNSKIFFAFGTLYPNLTGGMEVFNYHFLTYLLTNSKQDLFYFSDHPMEGHEDQYVAFSHRRPFRLMYPIQFFWQIFKRRREISCVVTTFSEQSWVIPFLQYIILKFLRKPYYVVIHWGSLPQSGLDLPLRIFFKNAVSVITVSEQIHKEYSNKYREGIFKYIPPLIPLVSALSTKEELRSRWGFDNENRIVLFVGSLKTMKNPEDVVEAAILQGLEYLKKEKLHYVFAGTGHLLETLKERCLQAGIQDHMHFTGLVGRHQIPELYKLADVFVISSDYEGTPLVLLEAFFNGLPVVASNVSGIRDLVQDGQNGLLYPVNRPDDLARSIVKLLNDPIGASLLGRTGKKTYAIQFSYENMIKEYEKLFASHLNKARVLNIKDFRKGKIKSMNISK